MFDTYLIYKSLHLLGMVAWFAALFYMPRLYVYHVRGAATPKMNATFKTMERKLYFFIATPAMIFTWVFGLLMLSRNPEILQEQQWLHVKILLVLILSGFHLSLNKYRLRFRDNINLKKEEFFRWYNEIPTILLILIVFLAVLRPF